MSVAPELVPVVVIPERARSGAAFDAPPRLASVTVLHAPRDVAALAPLRLTRRGVVVLAAAVLVLGAALVWLAKLSAPRPASRVAPPAAVTVSPGDTLWSIAAEVAPGQDPLAEVAALQRRNHLTGVGLVPGQVLRIP
jgi:Tfp pilus assembly protein FimV